MSELLDKLNREFEYLREENRNEETGKYLIELVKIVENNEGEVDSNRIRNLLNKMIKIISSEVLIPLTLNEGEFKYIKPGLSVNRRNANIIMDNYGIYYNKAFRTKVDFAYDSFTGKLVNINDCKNLLNDRIYIRQRFNFTSNYFTKCYLYDKTINKHNFTPRDPITIKTIYLSNGDVTLQFVDYNSSSFKSLSSCYKLDYNNDEENIDILEKLGINFNFKLDVIH